MDKSSDYAGIIKKTLHNATIVQPRLQAIKLYPVCDTESGHFLVLATGWDKKSRIDIVLFHARLVNRQVIIEEDNFEEALTDTLIAAGIRTEDILTDFQQTVAVQNYGSVQPDA